MSVKNDARTAPETVNDRVKRVRLALKLSQAKFCRGIPLTSGHYAEMELGNRKVTARTVKLIAASYGVSEQYLKTGEGDMFESSVDPRLEELVRIFRELPPDFQDFVLREMKELNKLRRGG
jgi:transcriptional regulator with XRE-family HTH domain